MMRKIVAVAVVLCFCGGVLADEGQVNQAIKVLIDNAEVRANGLRVGLNDVRPSAIETLREDGSPEAVAGLLKFLKTPHGERKVKQLALAALGRIGSKEAIDAIADFDTWAADRHRNPSPFRFGVNDFPSSHFAAMEIKPLAKRKGKDGLEWAVFKHPYEAWRDDWWLTASSDGKEWVQPIFLGEIDKPEDLLADIAAGNRSLDGFTEDTDKDGLSDLLEKKLKTDPADPDTDKDGIKDGVDDNPLTPQPKEAPDEMAQMRQAVFSIYFATCDSRDIITVPPGSDHKREMQSFHGYAGWVVPVEASCPGWVNMTSLEVKKKSDTAAEGRISDWVGREAAASYKAILEKKHGRWVVVEFRLEMIS